MKVYDVLIQSTTCNHYIDHFVTFEKPEIEQDTVRGVCKICEPDTDDARIVKVEKDMEYNTREEVIDWYEEARHHVDVKDVEKYFDYDDELGKFVPKCHLEVESVTVWASPNTRRSPFINLRDPMKV